MTTFISPYEISQAQMLEDYNVDYNGLGMPEGAHALSPMMPSDTAPAASKWYMSRWMLLPAGQYTIQAYSDDSATYWVGTNLMSSRMVVGGGLAVTSGSFYVAAAGLHRISVILQQAIEGPCYAMFAIYRDGQLFYVSRNQDWMLSTVPLPDENVPKSEALLRRQRRELPVWTLMPNWAEGVTERLTFYTDVMESESGAEQRRSVRRFPRRSLEVSMLRQKAARSRLDVFMAGVGRHKMLIPLFHEHIKMINGVTVDSTGVYFTGNGTEDREFRTGDLVLVMDGDPDDYEIMEVAEVEPMRFGWAEAPRRPWPAGTRIYPLREGRVVEAPTLDNITDSVGEMRIRFDLEEPDTRDGDWGVRDNGEPVFRLNIDRASPIQIGYDRKTFTLDNSSGRARITDLSNNTTTNMQFAMTLLGRTQVHSFRKFIAAARGRAEMFYCPTFMADVVPAGPIGVLDNAMDVAPMGMYQTMARPQPVRVQIAIQFKDSYERVYLNIKNVEEVYQEDVVEVRVNVGLGGTGSDRSTVYDKLNRPLAQSRGNWTVVTFNSKAKAVAAKGFNLGDTLVEHLTPQPPIIDPDTGESIEQAPIVELEDIEATAMADYLNGLRGDMPVMVMSDGGVPQMLAALASPVNGKLLADALARCGADADSIPANLGASAYLLAGVPGIGRARGLDYFNDGRTPLDIPVTFLNGGIVGVENRPGKLVAERLHFYETVPRVNDLRTISRISFMAQSRFDQDSFEIHHVTSGSRAARSAVVVRQFYNTRLVKATL